MFNLIKNKGFTFLEIILFLGVVAVLLGIFFLAINPTKQLGDIRNSQRRLDVLTILDAVYQYSIDNNNTFPAVINKTNLICVADTNQICQDGGTCNNLINLYNDLTIASSTYLKSMPKDPAVAISAGGGSRYYISKQQASGRITVCAPKAENGMVISVTR